jgi:hypothetical protein
VLAEGGGTPGGAESGWEVCVGFEGCAPFCVAVVVDDGGLKGFAVSVCGCEGADVDEFQAACAA